MCLRGSTGSTISVAEAVLEFRSNSRIHAAVLRVLSACHAIVLNAF